VLTRRPTWRPRYMGRQATGGTKTTPADSDRTKHDVHVGNLVVDNSFDGPAGMNQRGKWILSGAGIGALHSLTASGRRLEREEAHTTTKTMRRDNELVRAPVLPHLTELNDQSASGRVRISCVPALQRPSLEAP
jgi:hypothetical protein